MTRQDEGAPTYEGWTILELFGHRKVAGYVREQNVAGAGFLRIDVPGKDGEPVATQFYSPASVYAFTPTTEDLARKVAASMQPEPVTRWELPAPKSSPIPEYHDRMDCPNLDNCELHRDPEE